MSNGNVVDIVIPLQDGGSEHGDMELRYFLRSLCANGKGYRMVFVVTAHRPEWMADGCTGIAHVPETDIYRHNKDGNLFRKVYAGLQRASTENVIFTADDCAVLRPVDFATLPVTHAMEGANAKLWKARGQWTDRMRRTFDYVHKRTGNWLTVMYDSHLPTRLNRISALYAIAHCRELWDTDTAGININTAIVPFSTPRDTCQTEPWGKWKTCYERFGKVDGFGSKPFATWNDCGWDSGVKDLLAKRFPEPCIYERA